MEESVTISYAHWLDAIPGFDRRSWGSPAPAGSGMGGQGFCDYICLVFRWVSGMTPKALA